MVLRTASRRDLPDAVFIGAACRFCRVVAHLDNIAYICRQIKRIARDSMSWLPVRALIDCCGTTACTTTGRLWPAFWTCF